MRFFLPRSGGAVQRGIPGLRLVGQRQVLQARLGLGFLRMHQCLLCLLNGLIDGLFLAFQRLPRPGPIKLLAGLLLGVLALAAGLAGAPLDAGGARP